jgi:hypothetical protein
MSESSDSEEPRLPAAEVLQGVGFHSLPDGSKIEQVYAVIKFRDTDNNVVWSYRTSSPPNREELLGALLIQVDLLRKELLDEWEPDQKDPTSS